MSDWLKWDGEGVSPVKSTQKVEVKFDDGAVLRGYGFDFEWWHLEGQYHIVEYRIIEDDK